MENWELQGLFVKSYFAKEKMGVLQGDMAKNSHILPTLKRPQTPECRATEVTLLPTSRRRPPGLCRRLQARSGVTGGMAFCWGGQDGRTVALGVGPGVLFV